MEIPALQSQSLQMTDQSLGALQSALKNGKNASADDAKIADSCKQFESMLWRQMLDKALQPMLHSMENSADKTGTYNYFITSTISDAMSGGPSGISSLLQAQLINKSKTLTDL
jgi:Rod binding domain-containing protein